MKHLTLHLFLLLAVFALAGCSEDYDNNYTPSLTPRYLGVSPAILSFDAVPKSSKTLYIETVGTPWRLNETIDWISTDITSGDGNGDESTLTYVNVTVAENTNADEKRTGVFYLESTASDWSYSEVISVSQDAPSASLTLGETEVTFTGAGGTAEVAVEANCSYTAATNVDWLTAEVTDEGLLLTAAPNDSYSSYSRSATVTVTYGPYSYTKKITVSQDVAEISAKTDTIFFDNTAATATLKVTSEASWNASTSESWIEVEVDSLTNTLIISVSPNASADSRRGYIYITIGGRTRISIPVRQYGLYIMAAPKTITLDNTRGAKESVIIGSNTSWTVGSLPDWLSVDKASGKGNGSVTFTAEENPNTTARSATVTIAQDGTSVQTTIRVTQKGKTFDVGSTVLIFGASASTQRVKVSSDGAWTASTDDSWITVSPSSSTGNATLSVTVSENDSEEERQGAVIVRVGTTEKRINVVQEGKYFIIDNSLLDFNSHGGTLRVSLSTNTSWTAAADGNPAWLTLSPTSGTDSTGVVVTAADNPSTADRTATIRFEALGRSVQLLTRQKGRYLTLDASELFFYAKGGTSEPVTITTDGTYSIRTSGAWFTVNPTGNTFTVTAAENTGKEPRTGTITIVLTDLKNETYAVALALTQLNEGGSFLRREYGDDQSYDGSTTSLGNLNITPYGPDGAWDGSSASGVTITVVGYGADKDWNN